jgi:hypothetical protein
VSHVVGTKRIDEAVASGPRNRAALAPCSGLQARSTKVKDFGETESPIACASASGLLRQLRRQPWRIQRDVFLHAWPSLHQEPDVGVRGVEVDLELVEGAAPAPDIQPLRHIHQRRPLRIDAECVSIAQLPRGRDSRNYMRPELLQLLPLLRSERLQIAGNGWNSLGR